ncbi:hypothetical protein J43TS3_04890 [Ornithinibacillus bavariensis]|uniref:Uncharacterized protein n=2 Tax=Ornithinibacillus bavariensis TaxID=545502 RepID=A0A919X861_9BACI|nr:hypothetical protein J43TS3_04890 [Ornithinibacillus bavariensis]
MLKSVAVPRLLAVEMSMIGVRNPREEITMNMALNKIVVDEKMREMRRYAFETNLYRESKQQLPKSKNIKKYHLSNIFRKVS